MKNLKMKNLKNLRMSRRAVSPIIATLLLIAIAVAAAVVTYTFTMNMVSNQGSQAQTSMKIDDVQLGQAVSAGSAVSTTMIPSSTATTLYVAAITNFAQNDHITVGTFGTATISTTPTDVSDTTPAYFTLSGTGLSGIPTGNPTVTKVNVNAAKISIRNTGTVPVVIQTIYISQGSTQLFVKDQIGYALGAGTVKSLGLTTATGITATTFTDLQVKSAGITLTALPVSQMFSVATWSTNLEVSKAYTIKIVTDNGFNIEGVYYAPTSFGP